MPSRFDPNAVGNVTNVLNDMFPELFVIPDLTEEERSRVVLIEDEIAMEEEKQAAIRAAQEAAEAEAAALAAEEEAKKAKGGKKPAGKAAPPAKEAAPPPVAESPAAVAPETTEEAEPERPPTPDVYDQRLAVIEENLRREQEESSQLEEYLSTQLQSRLATDAAFYADDHASLLPIGDSTLDLHPTHTVERGLSELSEEMAMARDQRKSRTLIGAANVDVQFADQPGYLNTTNAYRAHLVRPPTPNHPLHAPVPPPRAVEETRVLDDDEAETKPSTAATTRTRPEATNAKARKQASKIPRAVSHFPHKPPVVYGALKNPRYTVNKPTSIRDALKAPASDNPDFVACPPFVGFTDYEVGSVYEQTVQFRNVGGISHRIRVLPPKSPYFSLSLVQYPNGEDGSIAPGMCCQVHVRFAPNSLENFEDTVMVMSEHTQLVLPLSASRLPPAINLPRVLDVGAVMVNNRFSVCFECFNDGGDGKFMVIPEEDWDDGPPELRPSPLSLGDSGFRIEPSRFELRGGDSFKVWVEFNPLRHGPHSAKFRLVCDNCQMWEHSVQGMGCLPEVKIGGAFASGQTVEPLRQVLASTGRHVPPDLAHTLTPARTPNTSRSRKEPADLGATLFASEGTDGGQGTGVVAQLRMNFTPTAPHGTSTKALVVSNPTLMALEYKWVIASRPSKTSEDDPLTWPAEAPAFTGFTVFPEMGTLEADGQAEFAVTFCPQALVPYSAVAELQTLRAFRDPSNVDTRGEGGVVWEAVPLVSLQLSSMGTLSQLELSPPILLFPTKLNPGKAFQSYVTIKNLGTAATKFRFTMPEETPHCSAGLNKLSIKPPEGDLSIGESLQLVVSVEAARQGHLDCHVTCDVQFGAPLVLQVLAEVDGCTVQIQEPAVNYGLVELGATTPRAVTIVNPSLVSLTVSLLHRVDLGVTAIQPYSMQDQRPPSRPSTGAAASQEAGACELQFKPATRVLKAGTQATFEVSLTAAECGRFRGVIQCAVEHGRSQYVGWSAEVLSPRMCVDTTVIDLGKMFVGVPVSPPPVVCRNLTMLPARFAWDPTPTHSQANAIDLGMCISPAFGVLSGGASCSVVLQFFPNEVGRLNAFLACDVDGMEHPLCVRLKGHVLGLTVSYHMSPSISEFDSDPNSPATAPALSPHIAQQYAQARADAAAHTSVLSTEELQEAVKVLPVLDFGTLKVCDRRTLTLFLVNHTSIGCTFAASLSTFGQRAPPRVVSKLPLLLTNDLEQTHKFRSKEGKDRVAKRDQAGLMASAVKGTTGLALLLGPAATVDKTSAAAAAAGNSTARSNASSQNAGIASKEEAVYCTSLQSYGTAAVQLTALVAMCGRYQDTLHVDIENEGSVQIPVRVQVVGSPLEVQPNTLGLCLPASGSDTPMALDWGLVPVNSPVAYRTLKLKNHSPFDIRVTWQLYTGPQPTAARQSRVSLHVGPGAVGVAVEPNTPEPYEGAFKLSTPQLVVGAQASSVIDVSFASLVATAHACYLHGHLELVRPIDPAAHPGFTPSKLPPIEIKLMAHTSHAQLHVDNFKHLKFMVSASDKPTDVSYTRAVTLTNITKAPLNFTLKTQPPFTIVSTVTSAPPHPLVAATAASLKKPLPSPLTMFKLAPGENVSMTINFKPPAEKRKTKLLYDLRYDGEVVVAFTNNDTQVLPLEARLLIAVVECNHSRIDFDTIHVDSTQRITMTLSNPAWGDARWAIHHKPVVKQTSSWVQSMKAQLKADGAFAEEEAVLDEPSVFTFTPPLGTLVGKYFRPEMPSTVDVEVAFKPQASSSYESRFEIAVDAGQALVLVLTGQGSFLENKVLSD